MANKEIDIFGGLEKPRTPPNRVQKDSEGRKEKRGDFRKLKHKGKTHE